ncbi:MAG: hypothetical protein BGO21_23055 [Dyadobacter sp. 50-39]|uniref:hypothetical protein n=1 Tax=Dyadobacter sp. 50-39 TaxID=1895756 RepID=UPI000966F1A8|nr:hypothetical protein [Dyadobacter sp. 50-39]OJV18429.1 MAG: hypothetical protein BGO21_23055 [Dyadobacter sp. 50-39]
MKILKGLITVLLLNATFTHAQYTSPIAGGVDVGVGLGSNSWAPSITYHEEIGSQKLPWLRLGVGLRAWGYYAGRTNLYTKRMAGIEDYLEYRNVSVNGVSFLAGVNISFWKLDFGVNTDLLGITYGTRRHGFYEKDTPATGTGGPNYNQWLASKPTLLNALPLALRKNTGQSEAFVRFKAGRKLGVKLGYTYGRVTYTTKKVDGFNVYLDNSQRHVSRVYGLPYAALAFAVGN